MIFKNIWKKSCLSFLAIITSCFIANLADAYSSQAIRFYNQGIENVKQEKYEEAIDNFKQAIYQDKTMKDAYFNLGALYKKTGEIAKAKDVFTTILRMDPYDDETAFVLAQLYFETKEYDTTMIYLNAINSFSYKYESAQALAAKVKQKLADAETAKKQSLYDWKEKTFKDLDTPAGVTADSKGNVYVANYKDSIIQKISPDDGKKENISNEDILGPVGLAVDSMDNLYVSSYVSNKVVQISPEGESKVILDNVKHPYYLFIKNDILYVTEQDSNSLIMLNLWK